MRKLIILGLMLLAGKARASGLVDGSGNPQLPAESIVNTFTMQPGSTLTIQGYAMQDIFISSYTFSGVEVATITLTSTGTYLNYRIVVDLQNVAGAAEQLFVKVGTDTNTGYVTVGFGHNSNGTFYDLQCTLAKRGALIIANGFVAPWYQSTYGKTTLEITQFTPSVISISSRHGPIFSAAMSPSGANYQGQVDTTYFGGSFAAYGTIELSFGTWSSCIAIVETNAALTGSVWVYAHGAER